MSRSRTKVPTKAWEPTPLDVVLMDLGKSEARKLGKTTPWHHHRATRGGVIQYSHDCLYQGQLIQFTHGEKQTRGCQFCKARRDAGQPFVVHTPRGLEPASGRAKSWYAP